MSVRDTRKMRLALAIAITAILGEMFLRPTIERGLKR